MLFELPSKTYFLCAPRFRRGLHGLLGGEGRSRVLMWRFHPPCLADLSLTRDRCLNCFERFWPTAMVYAAETTATTRAGRLKLAEACVEAGLRVAVRTLRKRPGPEASRAVGVLSHLTQPIKRLRVKTSPENV